MAPSGRERKKGEDWVREKGILDITIGRVHMSGLSNGRNQTEGERNGLEGKKKVRRWISLVMYLALKQLRS